MATLTMVASIDTMSRLRQQETRMMVLRRGVIEQRQLHSHNYCETTTVGRASDIRVTFDAHERALNATN